jgi:REP element-mobilizing transposase RayT
MANTYTQLRVHIVWAVQRRENMIPKDHREEVEKYITTCFQERKHKVLAIYCMPDHVHVFIGWHPTQSVSELVGEVKTAASKFIKKQSWMQYNFSWQLGFGAFSYAKSQTDVVVKYVLNQAEHHKKRTFREEYLEMLQRFEVDYKEEYLFEFYD